MATARLQRIVGAEQIAPLHDALMGLVREYCRSNKRNEAQTEYEIRRLLAHAYTQSSMLFVAWIGDEMVGYVCAHCEWDPDPYMMEDRMLVTKTHRDVSIQFVHALYEEAKKEGLVLFMNTVRSCVTKLVEAQSSKDEKYEAVEAGRIFVVRER